MEDSNPLTIVPRQTLSYSSSPRSLYPSIEVDTFTTRWTGEIESLYGEDYTFHTESDDGVRLGVKGQLMIDSWNGCGNRNVLSLTLQGGQKYDIKLEYQEQGAGAHTKLLWSSSNQTKKVVPTIQLLHQQLYL
ncbi:hypothetical protein IQ249_16450 [Lusitaniella coriacea LEGE 07157]|uniref:PA14 domain-containing protein n=1 Tax=Lusitaniella coriacea LEGE 07157 TaxID=945747 RepID=A0A8J7DYB8_9CYAN|nr:PA14 domain-containing protein [Lusitaniella coriacea]MBE9117492.1 hypothetical protein [Lusitaniella coriacea LEGE 07157]